MAQTITFEFDHQYAGDLASMGIPFDACDDGDYIRATVNKWLCPKDVFEFLDTHCDGWE